MIRINQQGASAAAAPVYRARGAGTTASFRPEGGRGSPTQAAGATAAPASLAGLIGLQSEEEAGERRRRRAHRGRDLLDGLDRLKAALLTGRVHPAELERLAAMLSARAEASDDPRLEGILAEIELRAAVELAKLGR